MDGVHLGTVHVEIYRARTLQQIGQSQKYPMPLAVSQMQVVEHYQVDLPIILKVAENG